MGSTERDEAIEAAMTQPLKGSNDTGSMERESIPNLIAADEHLAAKEAGSSKSKGIRFMTVVPGGGHG
jgi:hypothetical protein